MDNQFFEDHQFAIAQALIASEEIEKGGHDKDGDSGYVPGAASSPRSSQVMDELQEYSFNEDDSLSSLLDANGTVPGKVKCYKLCTQLQCHIIQSLHVVC